MEKKVILGSTSDFLKFIAKINLHDKATLRSYFKIACKKKSLLLLRTVGPCHVQILIIPLEQLPLVQQKISPKYSVGFAGIRIEKDTYFIFGEMILEQNEVGQFHSGEMAPLPEPVHEPVAEPELPQPKKIGRKKDVKPAL